MGQIAVELAAGRDAGKTGNDGKARVCARRAAGRAIAWYLTVHPRPWPPDAMMRLRLLAVDPAFSETVRDAAVRLATKISDRFTYPFSTDPLADASIIIDAIIRLMEHPDA